MHEKTTTNRKNSLLTEGDTILICDREFKIKELISDKGASAVCYKAECDGFGVGTLKEFIPINLNFHRNSNNQVVFDEPKQEVEKMIDDYIKPHKILMDKRKDENIAVFIPVFEILYSCSDDGKQASVYLWTPEPPKQTFEEFCNEVHANPQKKPEENLFHILTAVLSLSKCLIYIHRAQLLHRDIKPSNFGFPMLGNDKLSNNITIFDINTVCSVFADEYDKVFSEGFTEPENERSTNKTDIYSVGATLFYALTGNLYNSNNYDEIEMNVDDSELMKVLTNTIHPKLKGKIISVLKKTLAPREKRYSNCESLSFDIEQALKCFSQSETGKKFDKNIYFALQYHIYTNPVYKYIPKDSDSINILIIGFGSFAQKYLGIILQTVQMNRKKLDVTIISHSARKGKEAYLNERPKLKEFFNIDGSLADKKGLYGDIHFIEHTFQNRASDRAFLTKLGKNFHSAFISIGNDRDNADTAKTLKKIFPDCFVSAVIEENKVSETCFSPVYVSEDFSKTAVYAEIERMALNVHLLWKKNLTDLKNIKEEYRKPYNHDSSVNYVIAMRYRLFSMGFDMDSMPLPEICGKYTEDLNGSKETENRLIYEEHRRWNIEKAVDGYTTLEKLTDCIGNMDNKNKLKKQHICLEFSEPDQKLSELTHEEWDTMTKKEISAAFDRLDQVSIRLHQIFMRYAEKISFNLNNEIQQIRQYTVNDSQASSALNELAVCMEDICSNSKSEQWKRYDGLKSAFLEIVKNSAIIHKITKDIIKTQTEAINKKFYPIFASRQYIDYKSKDKDLVAGIPFILTYSTDISLAVPYNTGSGNKQLFANLASATVLNPAGVIFAVWITDCEQLDEIKNNLAYISAYMDNKKLRCKLEYVIGYPEEMDISSDKLDEVFKAESKGRTVLKQIQPFSDETEFSADFGEYLARKSKRNNNILLEKNNTFLSAALLSRLSQFPSYSFDSRNMKFKNINKCDVINYVDKNSNLTVNDLISFRRSSSISTDNPEFSDDFRDLFSQYLNNTSEWKFLCGKLKEYAKTNDLIANFVKPDSPSKPASYSCFIPFSSQKAFVRITDALISEGIIDKKSSVTTVSAGISKVGIQYKYGQKDNIKEQFDRLSEHMQDLMLGDIRPEPDTENHTVKVYRNDLYVKNLDCKDMQKSTIQLLQWLADNKYLTSFSYDSNNKKANFLFSSFPVKALLTVEGRILEIYVFHEIKKTNFFSDVRSSHLVSWENSIALNEIDLVATTAKGFNSLFVECKATKELKINFFTKIASIAEEFGINSKVVVIADTLDTPTTSADNRKCRDFGKRQGIITISDRKEIENIGEVLVKVMKGEYK